MPNPYKTINRKRFKRMRRAYRHERGAYALARGALKSVNYIKKELLNTEKKIYDVDLDRTEAQTSYDGLDAVELISGLGQGVGDSQRVGRQIKMDSFHIKGNLTVGASSVNSRVRVIVALYKDAQASAAPSITSLLEGSVSADLIYAHRAIGYGKSWFVYYDKVHTLSTATSPAEKIINIYRNTNKKYTWDGSAIKGNNLFFIVLSDKADATGQSPTFNGQCRVKYIDN